MNTSTMLMPSSPYQTTCDYAPIPEGTAPYLSHIGERQVREYWTHLLRSKIGIAPLYRASFEFVAYLNMAQTRTAPQSYRTSSAEAVFYFREPQRHLKTFLRTAWRPSLYDKSLKSPHIKQYKATNPLLATRPLWQTRLSHGLLPESMPMLKQPSNKLARSDPISASFLYLTPSPVMKPTIGGPPLSDSSVNKYS